MEAVLVEVISFALFPEQAKGKENVIRLVKSSKANQMKKHSAEIYGDLVMDVKLMSVFSN